MVAADNDGGVVLIMARLGGGRAKDADRASPVEVLW
jgi:hypothetical protein